MKAIKFAEGGASANVMPLDRYLHGVQDLYSYERGKGHARRVMEKIVAYADEHRITLFLVAQEYGRERGLDNVQLEQFYSKFGFEKDIRSARPVRMVRYPSREKQPL